MHNESINTLSGPDFLEAVADAESANGLEINAETYRNRAGDWKRDQQTIRELRTALDRATSQLIEDARHRKPAPPTRHAITPSGNR